MWFWKFLLNVGPFLDASVSKKNNSGNSLRFYQSRPNFKELLKKQLSVQNL